jgi:flagellar motor protein MotB
LKRVEDLLKDFSEKSVDVAGYTDNVAIKGAPAKKCSPDKELPDARAESAAHVLRDIVACPISRLPAMGK